MKKAMMYLLLALGITLGAIFVLGALVGFIAGFIDGFYGHEIGTTSSVSYFLIAGSITLFVLCFILNWVFLKLGYASYTLGRIPLHPSSIKWKIGLGMIVSMAGMAILYGLMMEIGSAKGWNDEFVIETYNRMRQQPIFFILSMIFLEVTANLIIYGGVLREVLEWKHRPVIVIHFFAVIMALISLLNGNPLLFLPAFLLAQFEGWVYEYTRSVIPIIIGDIAFWIVFLCIMGNATSGLWFVAVFILTAPGIYFTMTTMEPYKPID